MDFLAISRPHSSSDALHFCAIRGGDVMTELQKAWDEHVVKNYNHGSTSKVFADFLGANDIRVDGDLCDHALALKKMGLVRLPLVKPDDESSWFFAFCKLPVSAWLARAIPNSVEMFLGKSREARIAAFANHKTKRLSVKSKRMPSRNNIIKKKLRAQGGYRVAVKARELDKSHDWGTVK